MAKLLILPEIEKKLLDKHQVVPREVFEAFVNRLEPYKPETRPQHLTVPPTQYFFSLTNAQRPLKVIFIHYPADDVIVIKSAYQPKSPK